MERFHMTHSLLSSWLYTMKENPYEQGGDDSDEPKLSKLDEFMLTLNREPIPTNEAMQKGIDFENLVNRTVAGVDESDHKWGAAAAKVAQYITGSLLQCRMKKEAEVSGIPLLLYGRIDALHAGVVYDIKFSGSYEAGKFIDSTQHPMYLEICQDAYEFTYLVSNGSNIYTETYRREETPEIYPTIQQFFSWLKSRGLMDLYKDKWLAL